VAEGVWREKDLVRRVNWRLAVLQHAEEVSGGSTSTPRSTTALGCASCGSVPARTTRPRSSSSTTSCRGCRSTSKKIQTDNAEEFYRLLDGVALDDLDVFNDKLKERKAYYNYHRPHGRLAGQTPYARLLQRTQPHAQPVNDQHQHHT
jgi:hypothetical protein